MSDSNPNPFILEYQLKRNLRPFNRDEVRKLPSNCTGVYAIWLPDDGTPGECLYVGMSNTCLKTRLLSHLANETNPQLRRELRMFRDIVHFSIAYTQGHRPTLDLERTLTQEWQPRTNRTNL